MRDATFRAGRATGPGPRPALGGLRSATPDRGELRRTLFALDRAAARAGARAARRPPGRPYWRDRRAAFRRAARILRDMLGAPAEDGLPAGDRRPGSRIPCPAPRAGWGEPKATERGWWYR